MIYTKPIEEITYTEVLEFCAEQQRESIHLDYKRDIDRSLIKTVAAMANTWGGVIVIGVDEEDSKPRLPVSGLPYEEHIRERINNLILGNIMPPVFPEIQVTTSPSGAAALIVIRVPQSPLTPHAIRGNTQVYIRTDTSNEPEELATLDRIQWLTERRRKAEELKASFFRRAGERFDRLCKRYGVSLIRGDGVLAMSPLYPFELLRTPREIRENFLGTIAVQGWGCSFPQLVHRVDFQATQDGTYGFSVNTDTGYVCYEEANQYGFFYHREDFSRTVRQENKEVHYAFLHSLMKYLDLFLESMGRFYSGLGYWGMLDCRISLCKLGDIAFRDLPPPKGYIRFDDIVSSPVDDSVEFSKVLSRSELQEQRVNQVASLLPEMAWALGFRHIDSEGVLRLMKEAGRA